MPEVCTNKVIGAGSLDTKVILIGEAPGKEEDKTGKPFVGRAGGLLDELLEEAGIEREDIFITNILKCRPPENRKPRKGEIKVCLDHLIDQLKIIKPRIIAPMGNVAASVFFEIYDLERNSIGNVHGKTYRIEADWGDVILMPIYHPAAAVYNRNLKPELVNDMKKISELM
jgi:DNA polymerase